MRFPHRPLPGYQQQVLPTRFSEEAKKAGVSEVSFYRWRNKFAGNTVQDVRKLKQLEKDNARLLRLLGQRDVEIDSMKELLAKKW